MKFEEHTVNNPDFGKTAEDYRKHRQGFPQAFFDRLISYGVGLKGQRILDLGTGTGTVARGFSRAGCNVTAIDPSEQLIEQAKLIDNEIGINIDYLVATAENTKQANQTFDVVSAGQCWHWFNYHEAIQEIKRVINPTGRLVIGHFDWLPIKNSVPELTEQLILKFNPHWTMGGGTGFYPQWTIQLLEAGFLDIETYSFDIEVPYSHEAWRGRIRASAGIAASLSQSEVEKFDQEHSNNLYLKFPENTLQILHRCFTIIASPPISA